MSSVNRANTPHFSFARISSAASGGLFAGRPSATSDRLGRIEDEDGKKQKKSTRTETVGCNSALLSLFVLLVLVDGHLLCGPSLSFPFPFSFSFSLSLLIDCMGFGIGAVPSVRQTRGTFRPFRDRLKDSSIEYLIAKHGTEWHGIGWVTWGM